LPEKHPDEGPRQGRRRTTKKTWTTAALALVIAAATFTPALADDKDEIRPHPGGLIETKWLLDRPVTDTQGKELGKISEVWFDPKSGQVKEVIVDVKGSLGTTASHKILPWRALKAAWENQKLIVRTDEAALRAATERDKGTPSASPRERH